MRHFKTENGKIRAIDEDQEYLIDETWVEMSESEFDSHITPLLTQDDYSTAAQNVLDQQARSMGYDSIFTAVSYEGDAHQKFHDEAVALKAWRSSVWVAAYATLADVEVGGIAQPSIDEFLAMLPTFGG